MNKNKNVYVHRQIENILLNASKHFPALAITGPRQSGKSTLVKKIFENTHKIISLDDPLVREKATSDPRLFLETAGDKIVFDEIQYVPEILSYIKILIDNDRHKCGRFIFTGSQQFNLIKNLGDTLAGRVALLDLLPFSIQEMKKTPSLEQKIFNVKDYFTHSCLIGSYPELNVQSGINPELWYSSYIQTYIERDVRNIYNIDSLREFQQFLVLLAGRTSQILNFSSFANDLGISVNTVKKWISILEASRMIYILPPYYTNLGKRITKSPKIYFLDVGLVCYLTSLNTENHLLNGPLSGQLFENFVIQETIKYFFNNGLRPRMFFLRTNNDLEIDLILEQNLELFPIEIKLNKTPNLGMAKPIENFKQIFSKLNIGHGRIISLADKNIPLTKNVSVINIDSYLKFLNDLITH